MRDIQPELSCQCKRHPEACLGKMTQEDLLCDICRTSACSLLISLERSSYGHVLVNEFEWSFR